MREALAALIAAVLALLTRLIGPDLVARLLAQIWPGEPLDALASVSPPADPDETRLAAGATTPETIDDDAPEDASND